MKKLASRHLFKAYCARLEKRGWIIDMPAPTGFGIRLCAVFISPRGKVCCRSDY